MKLHDKPHHQPLIFRQRERLMRTNDNDQIISRRQIMPHMAESFAQKPPNPIAAGGGPDLSRHAHPQPRVRQIVWPRIDLERPTRLGNARIIHRREICA